MTLQSIEAMADRLDAQVALINDRSMPRIDFDELTAELTAHIRDLRQLPAERDELQILRTDYRQRIAGMIKAIAAVDRKRSGWEEALAYVERLESCDAAELVRQYRLVSARFRDAFPASFPGHLRGHSVASPSTTASGQAGG